MIQRQLARLRSLVANLRTDSVAKDSNNMVSNPRMEPEFPIRVFESGSVLCRYT